MLGTAVAEMPGGVLVPAYRNRVITETSGGLLHTPHTQKIEGMRELYFVTFSQMCYKCMTGTKWALMSKNVYPLTHDGGYFGTI